MTQRNLNPLNAARKADREVIANALSEIATGHGLRTRGGGYRYYRRVEDEGPRPWTETMGDPVAELARKLDAGAI